MGGIMKRIFFVSVLIIIMLYGCATEQPSGKEEIEVEKTDVIEPSKESVVEPSKTTITTAPAEPKECENFDIPAQNLDSIDLTLFTEGLQKTDKGFKFRLMPLDKEGNIMPLTGNLKVSMWTTKDERGELVEGIEIYTAAFYIKKENVANDCSSQEMEILFDDITSSKKYTIVSDDETGIINFEFKRTGSDDSFQKKYVAADFDERIFP